MHRSGTRVLARSLKMLGIELGDQLLLAQPDNPGDSGKILNQDKQGLGLQSAAAQLNLEKEALREQIRGLEAELGQIRQIQADFGWQVVSKYRERVVHVRLRHPRVIRLCEKLLHWTLSKAVGKPEANH